MDYGSNGYVTDACAVDRARSYVSFSSTCAGMDLTVTYEYAQNSSPNGSPGKYYNSTFTDVLNKKTFYTVGYTGRLTCIRPQSYESCKISVVQDSGIITETLSDGSTWTIVPDGSNVPNDPDYVATGDSIGWTRVTNSLKKGSLLHFEKNSLVSSTDENNRTATYKWIGGALNETIYYQTTDGNELQEIDYPEGNKYSPCYCGPFNVLQSETWTAKPGLNLPNKVIRYGFGTFGQNGVNYKNLAKPLSKVDENGNETDWTYKDYEKVASEMLPAPKSGAARPLRLYTYVGKSAYILNSSGTLMSTGQIIYLPDTEITCQTVAGSNDPTSCDSGAQKLTTTYLYGADRTVDNLLLKGIILSDGSTSKITCYAYDKYSHKISETLPNANPTTCA